MDKRVVATNRKARHHYFIEEVFEAGIILKGTEVKSLRCGKGNIEDTHAGQIQGTTELFLFNAYIPEYREANRFNHEPRRPRKLLLHSREISKLIGKVRQKGYTIMALSLFFNKKNKLKVELGLAKGKKLHDKRASEKERDWQREKAQLMREK